MIRRCTATLLVAILCTSCVSSPSLAQTFNSEQPSPANNILYFWGNEDLTDCWENFDVETGGSAEQGYGEDVDGGDAERLEVDVTCRMKFTFDENVYLNPGMKITVEIGIRVDHAEAESDEDEDLTITLMKGDTVVDSRAFPNLDNDQDMQLKWEIDVEENSTWWNASDGEPSVRFQISKVGWDASGTPCSGLLQVLKCGGFFRLYYSNNQDGMRTQIQFPIAEAPEVIVEEEPEEKGLPGFGLLSGFWSLAMAGAAFSRVSQRESLPPPR